MERERVFEIARSVKRKATYAAVAAGSAGGVWATGEGIMTGNKAETAIGIAALTATSVKVAWGFVPYRISIGRKPTNLS